ncbi:MAG: flavodoxin family protein [Novosphingobium sp.]
MTVAIIWHSRTGASQAMAGAIAEGARALGRLIPAERAEPQILADAEALIFVCPENLGAMSGAMKEMFDRTYYPLLGRIEGKAYATAIAAGSAGQGAEMQIDRIATGWRLRRVAESLIVNLAAQTPESILASKVVSEHDLARCHELGKAIAEGISLGIF